MMNKKIFRDQRLRDSRKNKETYRVVWFAPQLCCAELQELLQQVSTDTQREEGYIKPLACAVGIESLV